MPTYGFVYRCDYDYFGQKCNFETTNYLEIDAHENQLEPGHLVYGEMETIND